MAEEIKDEQVLNRLFEQISQHIETRVEYFTLTSTEKISALIASLAGIISIFVFAILVLFFFSMGFAWWLGDMVQSRAAGFALAGLIFIPIAIAVNVWIRPFIRAKIVETVLEETQKHPSDHE
jgi:hypothetical protein